MANKNIKINLDYSEFSGGIADCQRKMGLLTEQFKVQQSAMGENATEVDRLTLAQSTLSQKIGLQVQIVEQAEQRYKALAESEGATSAQVDNAQKSFTQQITKLNELTNQLRTVNDQLDEAAQKEESAGNSAGSASSNIENLASNVSSVVIGLASFVQITEQVAGAIMSAAQASTQWADDLSTLSSQTGLSVQTLQELAYASDFVDVSVETLQDSMTKLTSKMAEANNGSSGVQAAFDKIGVSVKSADGSLRSAEAVFYDVIDALGQIDNVAERDAAAVEIFGRSAQQLNPLIEQGSAALRKYGAEAERMGAIMSEDQVNALAEAQSSFDRLDAALDASSNRLSASFAPALAGVADVLSGLPSPVLDFANGVGKTIQVGAQAVGTFGEYAQTLSSLRIAKSVNTLATQAQTVAEGELAMAAGAANLAMLPEIALAGAIAVALAALASTVKELIDLYREYVSMLDEAGQKTAKVTDLFNGKAVENVQNSMNSGSRHYALGGRVTGRRVWVGEQGAELVDLPNGSTVYNHQESKNMTSSSNIFNVTIDAKNVDDFNKVVNVFNGLSQSMNRGGKVNG